MTLVVREGVYEMLEYLASFCNLYAYSHGLKDYILGILNIIDPYEKFFVRRSERVVAPVDSEEQLAFITRGKGFKDFVNPLDPCKCLFSESELQRCILIDD